jgi:dipeptidyl aminopeptidase/acylaminoacyl peptidase
VAFLRIPARDDLTFGPRRTGQPWSIRVADVTSGQGHEVWRAETGRGSVFRGIASEYQIFWGAGDNLVFPWEREGWTHLYSVLASGGTPRLLTPGDFEVEFVAISPDRRQLILASNQDDIDRRHLWSEPVTGDHPTPLTKGDGIEWSPVMLSDGASIALLHSDAQRPARPAILANQDEIHDLASDSLPADFPAAELVTPQQVILAAADGLRVHAQLFLPKDAASGERRPAVIFMHGNDVEGAGLYLRQRTNVDPNRIGLWGGSYGGYLTALGLARASDLFACGVDLHGVHDWNLEIENWTPSYDPSARQEAARLAWESSPLASVKTWRSPVLLVQGDDDRNVPFSEMVRLVEALRKQGVEFQQLVFPDEIHDFLRHRTWLAAYHAASDFFDQHLKK